MSISSEKTSTSGRGNIHDRLNTKDQPHPEYIASLLSPRRRQKQHRRKEAKDRSSGQCHSQRALCCGRFWTQGQLGNLQRSRAAHSFSLWSREPQFLRVSQRCLSPGAKTDFLHPWLSLSHSVSAAHSLTPTCITSQNKVPLALPH